MTICSNKAKRHYNKKTRGLSELFANGGNFPVPIALDKIHQKTLTTYLTQASILKGFETNIDAKKIIEKKSLC